MVDGASTDGTLQAIEPFHPYLAEVISRPDRGLYDAMNTGLAHATGDFVCFMNAGDIFANGHALSSVAQQIDKRDICYLARALIEGQGVRFANPPHDIRIEHWAGRNIPSHQVTFYPRLYVEDARYDLSIGSVADTDYTLRAFARHGWQFVDVDVAVFRLGGISNRFFKWRESWKAARGRWIVLRRHRSWFRGVFGFTYVAGPIMGWLAQKLFGPRLLSAARGIKGNLFVRRA